MDNEIFSYGYGNGGPRSYETFRVCWAIDRDASGLDFRSREARALVSQGLAGVEYVRGAGAREAARARAARRLHALRTAAA